MLARGERGHGVVVVQAVRRRQVHGVDVAVAEQILHARVRAFQPQRAGRALRFVFRDPGDALHAHAEPPQPLDVDRSDEARADDGGVDVVESSHECLRAPRRQRLMRGVTPDSIAHGAKRASHASQGGREIREPSKCL